MLVLGLDPGSRVTGWGLVEGDGRRAAVRGYGELRGPRTATRPGMLAVLAGGLEKLLGEIGPDVVAIETPFFGRFPASALALAEVRGALLAVLGRWGGKVVEYEPARVKSAVVGNGRAEKRQVSYILERQLGLPGPPPADAADALALAVCHLRLDCLDA
jgi:crossover junction endodeoxyribonuclease RuvC